MNQYSEAAETVVLQHIAQKKDIELMSTINQDWLHDIYQNLLWVFRTKNECLDRFYCESYVQENSIDVPLSLIETVFEGNIRGELEPVLMILEEKYHKRLLEGVSDYIYENINHRTALNIALEVSRKISTLTSQTAGVEKLGDNFKADLTDMVSFGIEALEDLCPAKQEMMIIGGESKNHKTNFTLHLLCNALEHNVIRLKNENFKVMFFSREMSFKAVKSRLISRLFRIPFKDVRYGRYNQKEIEKIFHEKYWYYNDNFILVKPESFTSEDDIAKFLLQFKPTMWGLDYIQLLANLKSGDDANTKVIRMITQLKVLCQLTNTLGIVVSQLRKFSDNRISKVPRLEDLYWAGDLHHLATWIGLCYWSYLYDRSLFKEVFFVLWEKNRNEDVFTQPLKVLPEYSIFENLPPSKLDLSRYLK